ncbi:MAG TPA: chemotaxis protein CheB [Synergistaceae bacterium]|nr:chemotaxis protein CheB [Synergistaceae bacterium]
MTFAQDKESAVVWGMPGEAVRRDGATHVLSPQGVARVLVRMAEGADRKGAP